MKIAIQGIGGAFHEEAARLHFGTVPIEIMPSLTFSELAQAVSSKMADKGVMAIENTIAGTILPNLELIRKHALWISDEVMMRIRQHLGGVPGASLQTIRKVYSHYMALNQCRPFFEDYPAIELIASEDTALSIKEVALAGSVEVAAIGSALATQQYGLEVLGEGIEASADNYTRFLVLSRQPQATVSCNKATLAVELPQKADALTWLISQLQTHQTRLKKIDSVTIPGSRWQYRYYLDLRFEEEAQLDELVKVLSAHTTSLYLLGKYTAATL